MSKVGAEGRTMTLG